MGIEQSLLSRTASFSFVHATTRTSIEDIQLLAAALSGLPDETVIDGEIVALNESGRPSFNTLQNYGTSNVPIFYYVFDVLVLSGQDLTSELLAKRRDLLHRHVLTRVKEPIRQCPELNASLSEVIHAVRAQGLEGVVAKNLKSRYEPGRRSGAWRKMRLNKGQEFVIGGYTLGAKHFDAVIFGYYEKVSSCMREEPATGLPQCRGNNCKDDFGASGLRVVRSQICPKRDLAAGVWV